MPSKQIFYQEGMELGIKELLSLFSKEVHDPKKLFFHCLDLCGPLRAQIALNQDCEDKLLFGSKRQADSHFLCTKLGLGDLENGYEQCNRETILSIQSQLPKFFKTSPKQEIKPSENPLFSLNKLSLGNKTVKSFFSYRLISEKTIRQVMDELTFFSHLYKEPEKNDAWLQLRVSNQDIYNKIVLANVLFSIKKGLVSANSAFDPILQITTHFKDPSGRKYVLSNYFASVSIESKSSLANEKLMLHPIHFVHQAPFLIDETLQLAADLFAQAFFWKKDLELKHLIAHIGIMRYLLTHIAPFKRGSAAISDWIETALYRHHGFALFQSSRQTDLKAISSLRLDRFMENYQLQWTSI